MNPVDEAPIRARELFLQGDEAGAVACLRAAGDDPRCLARLRDWALMERDQATLSDALARLDASDAAEGVVARAVAAQLRGDESTAMRLLQPLLDAADHPAAHLHAGRLLHNQGRSGEAEAELRRALALDPALDEARYSLAHVLRAVGDLEGAVKAYRDVIARRPGSRAALLNLGITLCAVDRPADALAPLDRLLALDAGSVEGWINRGLCLHVLGDHAGAIAAYRRVLDVAPGNARAHYHLGCLFNELLDTESAISHLERALATDPGDPDVRMELAGLMEQCNDLEAAMAHVEGGLALAPGHPGLQIEAARLERRRKRPADARERLRAIDAARLPTRLAQQYWFERALVHDATGDCDDAMHALARAHAVAAANPRRQAVDRGAYPRRIGQLDRWLADGAPGARPLPTDPPCETGHSLAFLVGFPRSGTTLLDVILDAHPGIASIEERPTLEPVAERLTGDGMGYPDAMRRLEPADLVAARARYLDNIAPFLPDGFQGLVVDKLPLRLLRAPLVGRLFPDALVMFMCRHPCDVVLSNYMQQYRPNEAFVHFDSLESTAAMYDRIMRTWRAMTTQLPLKAHVVRYERLVESPETEVGAVLDALGLELRREMLDPALRLVGRGRIETNSYHQVAEPIHARSSGRWMRYRRWLEPVLPVLEPHIEWLGYPDP